MRCNNTGFSPWIWLWTSCTLFTLKLFYSVTSSCDELMARRTRDISLSKSYAVQERQATATSTSSVSVPVSTEEPKAKHRRDTGSSTMNGIGAGSQSNLTTTLIPQVTYLVSQRNGLL